MRERGSGKYFGGGFSFVWNLDENNRVNKYDWKENQAECFMAAPYEREPTILMVCCLKFRIVFLVYVCSFFDLELICCESAKGICSVFLFL